MLTVIGMLFVIGMLVGMLTLLRSYQQRHHTHPEVVRKLLHIGMGSVCLSFPWLFEQVLPVLILAGITSTLLVGLRVLPTLRRVLGGVIHCVGRRSLGEILFPIGIATVFVLSEGDPLLYCTPVLLLTLADPAAALIGTLYGRWRYRTMDGSKTIEGSFAFFCVAFITIQSVLMLLSSVETLEIVVLAGLLSLLVTFVEGISSYGVDNLLIPVAGCLLLMLCLPI